MAIMSKGLKDILAKTFRNISSVLMAKEIKRQPVLSGINLMLAYGYT
jgi:hypothetical protein